MEQSNFELKCNIDSKTSVILCFDNMVEIQEYIESEIIKAKAIVRAYENNGDNND